MTTHDGRFRLSWDVARKAVQQQDPSDTGIHFQAVSHSEADQIHDRDVVDLVLRICELALATGASVAEATAIALQLFEVHQVSTHFDITNHSVICSRPGGPDSQPITAMRHVKFRRTEYHRLARLHVLVEQMCQGMPLHQAREEFNKLTIQPRLYRPWVPGVASGLQGGLVAVMLGAGWFEALIAGIAVIAVFITQHSLARHNVPVFFSQAIGGMIPTAIAMALVVVIPTWWPWSPSLVVAAGIVAMLAGLNLVGASQDALDGYYITSSGKILEVVVLTLGIIAGVMSMLWIGIRLGADQTIWPTAGFAVAPSTRILAASLVCMFVSITYYAPLKMIGLAFLLGGLGQAIYLGGAPVFGYGPLQAGIAAIAVGFCAVVTASPLRLPVGGLISSAITSLLPGSLIYRGLYDTLLHQTDPLLGTDAGTLLMQALLTAVLLAVGASLGRIIARPLVMPKSRWRRIALVKAWGRGLTPRMVRTRPGKQSQRN